MTNWWKEVINANFSFPPPSIIHLLTSFKAAFSRYCIDFGSVQNKYQVDLLFSLESYQIDLICISDRKWYDIHQAYFGGGEQMKIFFCTGITFTSFTNYNFYFIAPLSFLTSKTLLLFFLPKSYF